MSASVIDTLIDKYDVDVSSYSGAINQLWNYSLFTALGFDFNNQDHRLIVYNSNILQERWAQENGFKVKNDWQLEILSQQIDEFKPDIFYTNNPDYFTRDIFKLLPSCKVKAIWRAAPLTQSNELSHFDLGLSYGKVYLDLLEKYGVKNVEKKQFSCNPQTYVNIGKQKKEIDISFAGSYHRMFVERNQLLNRVFWKLFPQYKVNYYLSAPRGRFGRKYIAPFLYLVDRPPVYLHEFLKVISKSKIVFNRHSDMSKEYKGNMRVFETLGVGSFMLSDEGVYPEHLIPEEDFVTYSNEKDLIDKLKYYLKNEAEREDIAANGQRKLFKYYSLSKGGEELKQIFAKYL
ncbi:MAG: glycosyltransferase [Bacteroidota bacterium]